MKIKKMTAAAVAAAIWTAAAPMTGVLPDPLSVSVSAAEFGVGDRFNVGIDREGNVLTEPDSEITFEAMDCQMYCNCTVETENTIRIRLNAVRTAVGDITVPSNIGGFTVEAVFTNELQMTSITIPDTVKRLGDEAFLNCFALAEIKFGANSQLERIGKDAFKNCTSLKEIEIPKSVTIIDKTSFDGSALTNIKGDAGSYAETFAKENGYTFNGSSAASDTTSSASETAAPAASTNADTSPEPSNNAAPTASEDKGSPDTGAAGVASAAGVAILAGAAVIIIRKMKK